MNFRLSHRTFVLVSVAALLVVVSASGEGNRVIVSAGDFDRHQTLVVFPSPTKAAFSQGRDEKGNSFPVQSDSSGQISFFVDDVPKGTSRAFELTTGDSKQKVAAPTVEVIRAEKKLKVTNGGKPVLEYQAEASEPPRPDIDPIYGRGGYIHPVVTPGGRVITDDYPSNHKHHHGIWFPWTSTEFEGRKPDFWNMGDGKGRVEFVALDKLWSGPVHGGFVARHRFVDLTAPKPKAALNEKWEVRVYAVQGKAKPYWMFDLASAQECASASPLTLMKYYYGGLGVRGNWNWNGTNNTRFLTSEGETDRVKGNQTRARWCHMGGLVDGNLAGIAILCHPDNFRAPQPTRLHPGEPFFCYAPSQIAADPTSSTNKISFQIKPGETYHSRYRFIVQDGAPDQAQLDQLWNDYAYPPKVTVENH